MQQTKFKQWLGAMMFSLLLILSSCGGPKDADIQKSFADKASKDGRLSNVSATVADGVLTLTGNCPDESCRSYAEQSAKEIKGVKSVVNSIAVSAPAAPVEIAPDTTLDAGVRDAIKDYPGVNATVTNGEVTLTGTIQRSRLTNLMQSIQSLNPRKVNNNLTIQ
jgi:hyperosmotically inducible periplasmic protein